MGRFLRMYTLVLPGLLAGACGSEGEAPPARPERAAVVEDGPLVAFLGNSISAGLHLPKSQAFPAVLQRELAEDGLSFRLVNAGVSGDTTAGGVRRLEWLLEQDPDVVVVELGGNDGLRGIPLDTIRGNLERILLRIGEADARPVLLGMRLPPNYGKEYTEGYEALFGELAGELGADFLPFFMQGVAGEAQLNLPDGIHPTEEGHRRLAGNVEPLLREVLESLSASSF